MVAKLSTEAEYRVMTHTICEMILLQTCLVNISFSNIELMTIYYVNQVDIYIASNYVFIRGLST